MKYKDIKTLREQLWREQDKTCYLCKHDLELDDAVLDHSHTNGHIRAVIHRGCNAWLGKLENNLKRNNITRSKLIKILENLIHYIDTEREEIHPLHNKQKRIPKKPTKTKSINKTILAKQVKKRTTIC